MITLTCYHAIRWHVITSIAFKDKYFADKETESEWSKVNIDKETELMAMGLVSLEVIEEYEPEQV